MVGPLIFSSTIWRSRPIFTVKKGATVTSLESKVREEMSEKDLVLAMTNGLCYCNQEGTKGNFIIYKLILKYCDCFRKLTTMKKCSSLFFFSVCYFYICHFICSLLMFFCCRIAKAIFNTNWMQVLFSQNFFRFYAKWNAISAARLIQQRDVNFRYNVWKFTFTFLKSAFWEIGPEKHMQ